MLDHVAGADAVGVVELPLHLLPLISILIQQSNSNPVEAKSVHSHDRTRAASIGPTVSILSYPKYVPQGIQAAASPIGDPNAYCGYCMAFG